MRAPSLPLLAVVSLLVGACGSESPAKTRSAAPTPTATRSAEQQVADVAVRYIHAIANEDWGAACATRVRSEQEDFADFAGSCPKAMETMYSGKVFKVFGTATTAGVRIKGELAGVDLVQPGRTKLLGKLAAVRENGQWRLKDIKDSKIP